MTAINTWGYKRKALLLIFITALLKLFCANSIELSSAEVYYWTYSLHLQYNYFDHPPIVGWLIRLTTLNNLLNSAIIVRLGAVIASTGSCWLMFKIGTEICNERAGWFASLLFTSCLYTSYITGAFILPDSPQIFFWLGALLTLIKISRLPIINNNSIKLWSLFGIFSGLCIMCKVHGAFLWVGATLYVACIDRRWLKSHGFYIAALLTLAITSPIIFWNIKNNFITYKFHSSRVSLIGHEFHIVQFFKGILQSIFIIVNPFNFFLICNGILWSLRKKSMQNRNVTLLILFCSLPLIMVLFFVSFFRETLAHWSGPAYTCLLIIPAIHLACAPAIKMGRLLLGVKLVMIYLLIIIFSEIFIVKYYPGTLSDQKDGITLGNGDITLDMYGWQEASKRYDSIFRSDVSKKKMPQTAPIIITKWFPAAHIDFYFSSKTKQQTFGIGNIFELGQYYWSNKYKKPLKTGDSAYYIIPSNLFDYKTFDTLIGSFSKYELATSITEKRSGVICKKIYVFRLMGYNGKDLRATY
jgi:hypothetical protein